MAPRAAWTLVELAGIVARVREPLNAVFEALGPDVAASVVLGEVVTVRAEDLVVVRDGVQNAYDLVEQALMLAERLGGDGVVVDLDEVAADAAEDFEEGIVDGARALFAAGMLDVATGARVLSSALRHNEDRMQWDCVSIAEMLERWRGSSPRVAANIATRARIAPDTAFTDASDEDIVRLADVLDQVADDPSAY